jgi:DNA-binding MarR family transcriptional regulator
VGGSAADADQTIVAIERSLSDLSRLFSSARVHDTRVTGTGVQVSRTGLRVLSHLNDDGPVSVSRLARLLDMSQPTASRVLAALETDGLVARTNDPGDARLALYTTTAAGRKARARMVGFMRGQLTTALDGLPADRQSDLAELLGELVTRLARSQADEAAGRVAS